METETLVASHEQRLGRLEEIIWQMAASQAATDQRLSAVQDSIRELGVAVQTGLGKLEAKVDDLAERVERLNGEVERLKVTDQGRRASRKRWRGLVWASLAAAVGAVVTRLVDLFSGRS